MQLLSFMHRRCHNTRHTMSNWFVRRLSKKLQLDNIQQEKLSLLQHTLASGKSYLANIVKDREAILDNIFTNQGINKDQALHYFNVPRIAIADQAPVVVDALDDFYQSLDSEQQLRFRSLFKNHSKRHTHCCH